MIPRRRFATLADKGDGTHPRNVRTVDRGLPWQLSEAAAPMPRISASIGVNEPDARTALRAFPPLAAQWAP